MALNPGTRLGPYEIVAAIGAGGMGEVYRARDPRLQREVALKVPSPEVARDAHLRARFEREARAVAALNHPHVVTVYDVGESAEIPYIAFEFIAGTTLEQRLRRSRLDVRDAIDIAVQIASGLAHAHD